MDEEDREDNRQPAGPFHRLWLLLFLPLSGKRVAHD
jgi:hypothetical protein